MATQPGDNVRQGPTQPGGEAIFGETKGKRATMPGDLEEENTTKNHESIYTLAGFLVSFSKTEKGEYWPLRQGNNTIGTSAENSIILNEEHVTGKHATINILKEDDQNSWVFQITDHTSTNGTFINGKRARIGIGEPIEDKVTIKIGEYYLKLITADKYLLNLSKNERFIDSKPAQEKIWDDPTFLNSKRPTNT